MGLPFSGMYIKCKCILATKKRLLITLATWYLSQHRFEVLGEHTERILSHPAVCTKASWSGECPCFCLRPGRLGRVGWELLEPGSPPPSCACSSASSQQTSRQLNRFLQMGKNGHWNKTKCQYTVKFLKRNSKSHVPAKKIKIWFQVETQLEAIFFFVHLWKEGSSIVESSVTFQTQDSILYYTSLLHSNLCPRRVLTSSTLLKAARCISCSNH